MQHENNRHNESASGKAAPQNIAAKNEEQAKQKTEPLENDGRTKDKREGDMDNGELGADIKKENE
jgi:hypothetical protein